MTMARSWTGILAGADGFRAGLAYYPPGLVHGWHRHRAPHVSAVIAGSFRECTPAADRVVCQGSVGFRADAARHSVVFGPAGALILSVDLHEWIRDGSPGAGVRWLRSSGRFARELVSLARSGRAGAGDEVADRLLDLWAGTTAAQGSGEPPAWLRAAAERLLADPESLSIGALACELGVHRVHLSRSFARHFGMAPSVFRRRAMASRALAAAFGDARSLADAAALAGFADQSHMVRAVRETCALGIGEMRGLLGAKVTSVQARAAAGH
jgi:AraC family transcriptional regulator